MENLTQPLKKLLDKLLPLLLFLSIAWLCWGIARGFWLFLAPVQAPSLPAVAKVSSVNTQAVNPNAFSIFARPKPKTVAAPPPMQAPSNFELKGVMVAYEDNDSSALISISGDIKNYKSGKPIKGTQYTLSSVNWNSVTLTAANGSSFDITLNERFELNQSYDGKTTATNSGVMPTRNQPITNIPPAPMKPISAPVRSNKPKQNQRSMVNDVIESAADQLEEDAAGYLGSIGVLATGDGYEVTDSVPSGIRSRIGIKAGDKIISVNGEDVGYIPANDAKLLRDIKQSGRAEIKVKRGEQIITIRQAF